MINEGQIKIDNKTRRIDLIIPTSSINETFKSQAQTDYEKKKEEEKRQIREQINRANS